MFGHGSAAGGAVIVTRQQAVVVLRPGAHVMISPAEDVFRYFLRSHAEENSSVERRPERRVLGARTSTSKLPGVRGRKTPKTPKTPRLGANASKTSSRTTSFCRGRQADPNDGASDKDTMKAR